jgi:hypothetical protein
MHSDCEIYLARVIWEGDVPFMMDRFIMTDAKSLRHPKCIKYVSRDATDLQPLSFPDHQWALYSNTVQMCAGEGRGGLHRDQQREKAAREAGGLCQGTQFFFNSKFFLNNTGMSYFDILSFETIVRFCSNV